MHRGARLGQEVLDDHLLHVAVAARGRRAMASERVDALGAGLADADEDAGGERDRGSPAASRVASRRSGVLSGAPWCGPPGSPRRAASVSIIIPCDGLTRARSRASSSCESAPALAWGSSPVSSSTGPAAADEVVDGGARSRGRASHSRGDRVAVLGRLAEREQRLVAAERGARRAIVEHLRRARGTGASRRAGGLANVQ